MFFDTNVIIKYLTPDCDENLFQLIAKNSLKGAAYISGIVFSEVLAYQGYDDTQAKDIEKFLKDNFIIYDISEKVLVEASRVARDKKKETSKKLKLTDAMIIATAILNNKDLLTFDREDFKQIKDLKLFKL